MDAMKILSKIDVEPILFIYMLSSSLKMPVFLQLIYTKECISIHSTSSDHYPRICDNASAINDDQSIQSASSYLFTLSSLCLTLPALIITLMLGSFADRFSRKLAVIIPLVGLLLGDVNYVIQATYLNRSPFELLISDVIFGVLGGYIAVLSTTLSYSTDRCPPELRSYKMAFLESLIALGSTIGFFTSGILLDGTNYRTSFLIQAILHFICVAYAFLFLRERTVQKQEVLLPDEFNVTRNSATKKVFGWGQLIDFWSTIVRDRPDGGRIMVWLVLAAFFASYTVMSGTEDIMLYYLKGKLNWNTTTYGYFRGFYYGSATLMVLVLYPLLKRLAGLRDTVLALIGLFSRMAGSVMLAFTFSTWFTFCIPLVYMFNRFGAAAMRSMVSGLVQVDEQGKIFAAVGLIEGVCDLLASAIFNSGVYPASLSFFPGLSYLLMAITMLVPTTVISYVHVREKRKNAAVVQTHNDSGSDTQLFCDSIGSSVVHF